jgi:uncharacterized OB-fold protein
MKLTEPSILSVLDAYPDVMIDHDNIHFYAGLLRQELVLNCCRDCGHWHSEPLRSCCPQCWSWNLAHQAVSGLGEVFAITRLHQGPPLAGVSYSPPLALAIIELDEQPHLRVMGGLVEKEGQELPIGTPVELTWPVGIVAPRLQFSARRPQA